MYMSMTPGARWCLPALRRSRQRRPQPRLHRRIPRARPARRIASVFAVGMGGHDWPVSARHAGVGRVDRVLDLRRRLSV